MFLGVFMNANPPNLWKKSKNKINHNVFTDTHSIQLKFMQNAIFFLRGWLCLLAHCSKNFISTEFTKVQI